ncbi:hypothetical protein HYV57_05510 [Candidatus Peregrinibacteria bacterium]|nr:hypothetical protein [Candidatus Peregrinibacteria bacterium]
METPNIIDAGETAELRKDATGASPSTYVDAARAKIFISDNAKQARDAIIDQYKGQYDAAYLSKWELTKNLAPDVLLTTGGAVVGGVMAGGARLIKWGGAALKAKKAVNVATKAIDASKAAKASLVTLQAARATAKAAGTKLPIGIKGLTATVKAAGDAEKIAVDEQAVAMAEKVTAKTTLLWHPKALIATGGGLAGYGAIASDMFNELGIVTNDTAIQKATLAVRMIEEGALQKLKLIETTSGVEEDRLGIVRGTAKELSEIVGYTVHINTPNAPSGVPLVDKARDNFGLNPENGLSTGTPVEFQEEEMDALLSSNPFVNALFTKIDQDTTFDWNDSLTSFGEGNKVSLKENLIKSEIIRIFANPDIPIFIGLIGQNENNNEFLDHMSEWMARLPNKEITYPAVDSLLGLLRKDESEYQGYIDAAVKKIRIEIDPIKNTLLNLNIALATERFEIIDSEFMALLTKDMSVLTLEDIKDFIEFDAKSHEVKLKEDGTLKAKIIDKLTEVLKKLEDHEAASHPDIKEKIEKLSANIKEININTLTTDDKNPVKIFNDILAAKEDAEKTKETFEKEKKEYANLFGSYMAVKAAIDDMKLGIDTAITPELKNPASPPLVFADLTDFTSIKTAITAKIKEILNQTTEKLKDKAEVRNLEYIKVQIDAEITPKIVVLDEAALTNDDAVAKLTSDIITPLQNIAVDVNTEIIPPLPDNLEGRKAEYKILSDLFWQVHEANEELKSGVATEWPSTIVFNEAEHLHESEITSVLLDEYKWNMTTTLKGYLTAATTFLEENSNILTDHTDINTLLVAINGKIETLNPSIITTNGQRIIREIISQLKEVNVNIQDELNADPEAVKRLARENYKKLKKSYDYIQDQAKKLGIAIEWPSGGIAQDRDPEILTDIELTQIAILGDALSNNIKAGLQKMVEPLEKRANDLANSEIIAKVAALKIKIGEITPADLTTSVDASPTGTKHKLVDIVEAFTGIDSLIKSEEEKKRPTEDKRKVTASSLNLRDDDIQKIKTTIPRGAEVTVLPGTARTEKITTAKGVEETHTFVKVISNGNEGWMAEKYLQKQETETSAGGLAGSTDRSRGGRLGARRHELASAEPAPATAPAGNNDTRSIEPASSAQAGASGSPNAPAAAPAPPNLPESPASVIPEKINNISIEQKKVSNYPDEFLGEIESLFHYVNAEAMNAKTVQYVTEEKYRTEKYGSRNMWKDFDVMRKDIFSISQVKYPEKTSILEALYQIYTREGLARFGKGGVTMQARRRDVQESGADKLFREQIGGRGEKIVTEPFKVVFKDILGQGAGGFLTNLGKGRIDSALGSLFGGVFKGVGRTLWYPFGAVTNLKPGTLKPTKELDELVDDYMDEIKEKIAESNLGYSKREWSDLMKRKYKDIQEYTIYATLQSLVIQYEIKVEEKDTVDKVIRKIVQRDLYQELQEEAKRREAKLRENPSGTPGSK